MGLEKYIKSRIYNLDDKIPKCKDVEVKKILDQKRSEYRRLIGWSV